jgi:hypothetical protein
MTILLLNDCTSIFNGCLEVGNVKEFQVVKAKNSVKEGRKDVAKGGKVATNFVCDKSQWEVIFPSVKRTILTDSPYVKT